MSTQPRGPESTTPPSDEAFSGRPENLADADVVRHNLDLMDTEMRKLMVEESGGGSAHRVKIDGKTLSNVATNGRMDSTDGKIVAFGNLQSFEKDTPGSKFTFLITSTADTHFARSLHQGNFGEADHTSERIIDFIPPEDLTAQGDINAQAAILLWNQAQEKPPKNQS